MVILSIETSCDDTGVSLIKASSKKEVTFEIISNIVSSQVEIHKKWGGVYPLMAKREHQKNIIPIFKRTIKDWKAFSSKKNKIENLDIIFKKDPDFLKKIKPFLEETKKPKIDAVAITEGPGLEPCLWTGVNFARAISYSFDIPLIPVNHIEAHILSSLLYKKDNKKYILNTKEKFPAIGLIVSGGHTQIIFIKKIGDYKILGETRDDAAGECLDKTARILGLSYPGGPEIAKKAEKFKGNPKITLPRPMVYSKNYDFSFSGLKTAVLYKKQRGKVNVPEMCKEIQQSVIDVLIKKTLSAAKEYNAKSILLGGGVVANKELRKQFKKRSKNVIFPEKMFCMDNAAMIGVASFFKKPKSWKNFKANANLKI